MRVSGVDLKVEFWRFRPCPFLGSNGSPHSKDLQTMVSHAHWERKLSSHSSLRSWLCHTVLGIAVKAPRAWLPLSTTSALRIAIRWTGVDAVSLVPGLGLSILLSAE